MLTDPDEVELKTRLERATHMKIRGYEWRHLERQGLIRDYYGGMLGTWGDDPDEDLRAFVKSAFEQLQWLRATVEDKDREELGAAGQVPRVEPSNTLFSGETADEYLFDPSEIAQAKAMSEYMAGDADQLQPVIEFRNRVLGGDLVSLEEARTLIETPGDVSTELHGLGNHLAGVYHGWEPVAAMRFILTGRTPDLSLVKVRHTVTPPPTVTLTITPWVSAETVKRVYRSAQSWYRIPGRRKKKPRTLEVAQFYWEQNRLEGNKLPWPVLFERWQQRYPEREGFTDWRSFQVCAKRGLSAALSTLKGSLSSGQF